MKTRNGKNVMMILTAVLAIVMMGTACKSPSAPKGEPLSPTGELPAIQTEEHVMEKEKGGLTDAEKQELDDACLKLAGLEAELEKLTGEGEEMDEEAWEAVENQMAPLRIRVVELTEKGFTDKDMAADEGTYEDYVKGLNLTKHEKQEMAEALNRLEELWNQLERLTEGSGEYTDVMGQMDLLEVRIAELEDKAFPCAADEIDRLYDQIDGLQSDA